LYAAARRNGAHRDIDQSVHRPLLYLEGYVMRKTVLVSSLIALAMAPTLKAAHAQQATFANPVAVDDSRPASEPGIVACPNGKVFVNAPPGLPGPGYVWRSDDNANSFLFKGPGTVGATSLGVDVGGGDSNLACDASSNDYFVDLWLGNSSSAFSGSNGDSWIALPVSGMPVQDRPWVAADPKHTGYAYIATEQLGTGIYLSIALPQTSGAAAYAEQIVEVTDAQRGLVGAAPAGTLVTNLKGDTYNVYSIFTGTNGAGIGLSKLPFGSLTPVNSTVTPANDAHDQTQCFPVVAVDNAQDDNLYVVWCDPVSASDWNIRFASFNGTTWSQPVTVGHGVYPWVTADSAGKVDIGWYSAERSGYIGDPNAGAANHAVWDVDFAQSTNALASTPSFSLPQQAATAVKAGNICTQGTNCSGDRELGDFMSIAHDAAGNAILSYVYVPTAGTGLVRVVKQTAGPTIQ
jgi:hypothetical protein